MSGQIKVNKSNGFTQVPNAILRRKDLTWKAKGLLCYLLSLDENWQVYKSDLKNRSKDGYDSMITGFEELEKAGYIETIKLKGDGGLFSGVDYIIYEEPDISRVRDFPETDKPETDNPQLINNSFNKNKKATKDERKEDFRKSLIPFLNKEKNYTKEFIRIFFDYWTETSNNIKTLRFEEEKFFDLSRRLSTFQQRKENNSFNKNADHSHISN